MDDLPNQLSEGVGCRKCGQKPFIVLDRIHIECQECFLESCNRKLRSTIGKSKMMRNNDAILIAYSGGPSSTALLDLVQKSIESDARREQKFRPSILYIDNQLGSDLEDPSGPTKRVNRIADILRELHQLYPNWPIYWSTLEIATCLSQGNDAISNQHLYQIYEASDDSARKISQSPIVSNEALLKFHEALRQLDLTDKQKQVQSWTCLLIGAIANAINLYSTNSNDKFKLVFTGSSATQLANDLLVDVILGQGSTICSTVNVCDRRYRVPILRPMREFSKKEVALYVKARNLEPHIQANLLTYAHRKASIQTVTESFLSKLYVNYPSTYSTLLRTGNKMQYNED